MRVASILAVSLSAWAVTGCVTNESMQEAGRQMKADPTNRASRIEACVRNNPTTDRSGRLLARELRLEPGPEAARTICARVADGIMAGRISASDFDTLRATGSPTPRLMQVLLGR